MNRRDWLGRILAAAGMGGQKIMAETPLEAASIMSRISVPVFPKRDFAITEFGAVGDGARLCTISIANAIRACNSAGGGSVVIPEGRFLTGAVHLESNVNLHLLEGATLAFSREPKDYLPAVFTRFEGTECMNYSPFIYAFEKNNIAVTGQGVLDGHAGTEHWWPWVGKERGGWTKGMPNQDHDRQTLTSMGDSNVPVPQRLFGESHYLRPNFIQPYRCKNVLLDGISIVNSPMWEINPVLCQNVIMRGISIDSHGPNNDGCDPESCDGVLIAECTFSTGDDCIAVKSGRNQDGRRVNVACQNVLIRDCVMKDGHGGVSIGSEVSGGVRNVLIEKCQMSSPNLERALRIKTNSYRGGVIENIAFRDVTVGEVAEAAIEVDYFYQEGAGGPFKPVVRGIDVENVSCEKSKHAIFLRGYRDAPISGVTILHCQFQNSASGVSFENADGVVVHSVMVNGKMLKNRP